MLTSRAWDNPGTKYRGEIWAQSSHHMCFWFSSTSLGHRRYVLKLIYIWELLKASINYWYIIRPGQKSYLNVFHALLKSLAFLKLNFFSLVRQFSKEPTVNAIHTLRKWVGVDITKSRLFPNLPRCEGVFVRPYPPWPSLVIALACTRGVLEWCEHCRAGSWAARARWWRANWDFHPWSKQLPTVKEFELQPSPMLSENPGL